MDILYILLKIKIWLLSSIAPLCLVMAFYSLRNIDSWEISRINIFDTWIMAEALFFFLFLWFKLRLQNYFPHKHEMVTLNQVDRWKMFEKCIMSVQDLKVYLSKWFFGADFKSIYRDNLKEFLSWAFFVEDYEATLKRLSKTDPEKRRQYISELNLMIFYIEKKFKIHFSPGRNTNIECMRLNLDPISPIHKPLIYYLVIWMLNSVAASYYRNFLGMKRFRSIAESQSLIKFYNTQLERRRELAITKSHDRVKIPYWYRPPKNGNKENPLLFVHGIGVGLFVYVPLISKLAGRTERPIFVVEMQNVSTGFFPLKSHVMEDIPTHSEMAESIELLLQNHSYCCKQNQKCTFVGHSLGSTVVAWIVKNKPHLVDRMVFLDPVCFLLHEPDIAYNFMYREPQTSLELLLWWYASKELYISWTLSRCFFWFHGALFLEDLPENIKVDIVLGADDVIVKSSNVRDYIMKISQEIHSSSTDSLSSGKATYSGTLHDNDLRTDIRIFYFFRKNHAQFLFDKEMETEIVGIILRESNDSRYFRKTDAHFRGPVDENINSEPISTTGSRKSFMHKFIDSIRDFIYLRKNYGDKIRSKGKSLDMASRAVKN